MKYYVYLLKDKNGPFYVGKGSGRRMYVHKQNALNTDKNSPLLNRLRKMIEGEQEIIYEKVLVTNDEDVAFQREIELIDEIGRVSTGKGPLLNLTEGGEGVRDYIMTEDHKRKISEGVSRAIEEGRFTPGGEYERTEEYRQTQSERMIAYYETPEGQERKRQISMQKKALLVNGKRNLSPEARQRLSEARRKANLERSASQR